MKNGRYKLIRAVFARAKELGIDQETLRDDIAFAVIGKRLSKATAPEIARVIDYITRKAGTRKPETANRKRYESSRQGLIEEIKDIAKARFGDEYAHPLNAFCARFGEPDGFRRMRVDQMKRVKQRLLELQETNPR